jgi:hypothetical protein
VRSVRPQQKYYFILLENLTFNTLLVSAPPHLLFTLLLVFPSHPRSFDGVSMGKSIPVVVSETAHHQLRDTFDSAAPVYTVRNWKSVTPCNPREEVFGCLHKVSTNVDSESECAAGYDHNMECVAAER